MVRKARVELALFLRNQFLRLAGLPNSPTRAKIASNKVGAGYERLVLFLDLKPLSQKSSTRLSSLIGDYRKDCFGFVLKLEDYLIEDYALWAYFRLREVTLLTTVQHNFKYLEDYPTGNFLYAAITP